MKVWVSVVAWDERNESEVVFKGVGTDAKTAREAMLADILDMLEERWEEGEEPITKESAEDFIANSEMVEIPPFEIEISVSGTIHLPTEQG